jgi:hypothetical protein
MHITYDLTGFASEDSLFLQLPNLNIFYGPSEKLSTFKNLYNIKLNVEKSEKDKHQNRRFILIKKFIS